MADRVAPAAWLPDPTGRNAQRYWDGARWTELVAGAEGGTPVRDPLDEGMRLAPPQAHPVAPNPALADQSFPAGWYADPSLKFERRYWSGAAWTEHVVSDAGERFTDPVNAAYQLSAPAPVDPPTQSLPHKQRRDSRPTVWKWMAGAASVLVLAGVGVALFGQSDSGTSGSATASRPSGVVQTSAPVTTTSVTTPTSPASAASLTDPAMVAKRISNVGLGCADYAPQGQENGTITIGGKDAQPTSSGNCTTNDGTILKLNVYKNTRALQLALASSSLLACSLYKGIDLYVISKSNWTIGGTTLAHALADTLATSLKGKLTTINC